MVQKSQAQPPFGCIRNLWFEWDFNDLFLNWFPPPPPRTEALEAREGLAEDLCSEEISKTGASLDYVPLERKGFNRCWFWGRNHDIPPSKKKPYKVGWKVNFEMLMFFFGRDSNLLKVCSSVELWSLWESVDSNLSYSWFFDMLHAVTEGTFQAYLPCLNLDVSVGFPDDGWEKAKPLSLTYPISPYFQKDELISSRVICYISSRNLQQDRSWTDPEKKPVFFFIAPTVTCLFEGSVGIRSHSNLLMDICAGLRRVGSLRFMDWPIRIWWRMGSQEFEAVNNHWWL